MASVLATVQEPGLTATTPTVVTAAVDGNHFAPIATGRPVFVRITNGSGGSITTTLDDPTSATPEAAATFNPDVTWVVGAGATRMFKITDIARFKNPATGFIQLTYSAVTSLTLEFYS